MPTTSSARGSATASAASRSPGPQEPLDVLQIRARDRRGLRRAQPRPVPRDDLADLARDLEQSAQRRAIGQLGTPLGKRVAPPAA